MSGLATHVSAMGEWVQLIGKPMEQELLDVIDKSWCAVPAARGLSSGGHTEGASLESNACLVDHSEYCSKCQRDHT